MFESILIDELISSKHVLFSKKKSILVISNNKNLIEMKNHENFYIDFITNLDNIKNYDYDIVIILFRINQEIINYLTNISYKFLVIIESVFETFFYRYDKISEKYDILLQNYMKILDNYRLYSYQNLLFSIDYFSIICENN